MIRLHSALLACCAVLLLFGCGDDPQLPPAKPLQAAPAAINQLYGARSGPHRVASHRDLALPAGNEQRKLGFNLYYPDTPDSVPLLLFSHGNWSDKDSYDRVITYWVSHGYAVIAPNHLDCCSAVLGIFNSLRHGQVGLVEARVQDMQRLLANLPQIEAMVPGFTGKADLSRLGVTGHSFGAFTAQQFGGARVFDPDSGTYLPHSHSGVKAIVALSPPGPMFDTITADSWLDLETPTLVSTGTWDIQPRFWPDWRMHLISFETALPGDKYGLVIDGADHYLGNLICRPQRKEAPQEDALRMLQIASTAFLDAYLKGNESARTFLAGSRLEDTTGGFARLFRR